MTPTPTAPERIATLIAEIQARQNGRRQPAVGTCAACGHRQEMMPSNQPCPSSLAEQQWKCEKCGGQISVMVTIGGMTAPLLDDDIDSLLAALSAETQARQEAEAMVGRVRAELVTVEADRDWLQGETLAAQEARQQAERDLEQSQAETVAADELSQQKMREIEIVWKKGLELRTRAEAAEQALAASEQARERLRTACEAFLAKWALVLPEIKSAFMMQHIHGGRYDGPTIDAEIEAISAALAISAGPSPDEAR